jgi:hypothetical protein
MLGNVPISERADMERDDIKKWQAKKIASSLQPSLNYLFRLRQQMEKVGFLPGDSYYQWSRRRTMRCTLCGSRRDPDALFVVRWGWQSEQE